MSFSVKNASSKMLSAQARQQPWNQRPYFESKRPPCYTPFIFSPLIAENFIAALLARNVTMEEDLCDQLFNHTELRLACMLLKMSRQGRHVRQQDVEVPSVTHKKLAKIIGTTPSKIVFFMHKFRKQGLIDYEGDGDVKVMPELLTDMILRA